MVTSSLNIDKIQQKSVKIRLFLLDVDGVLTNGKLYFNAEGHEMRAIYTLEGQTATTLGLGS